MQCVALFTDAYGMSGLIDWRLSPFHPLSFPDTARSNRLTSIRSSIVAAMTNKKSSTNSSGH